MVPAKASAARDLETATDIVMRKYEGADATESLPETPAVRAMRRGARRDKVGQVKRCHTAHQRAVLVSAALSAVVLLAGWMSAGGQAAGVDTNVLEEPPSTATTVLQVRPLDANGQLRDDFEVRKTITKKANCLIDSEKVKSALRCSAGDFLYQPCWIETGSKPAAICLIDPWDRYVSRLKNLSPPPSAPKVGDFSDPWGIELENGRRCSVLTGAHSSVGTEAMDYDCGGRLFLLRGIDQTTPVWHVRSARFVDGSYRFNDHAIRTAWF